MFLGIGKLEWKSERVVWGGIYLMYCIDVENIFWEDWKSWGDISDIEYVLTKWILLGFQKCTRSI